MHDEQKLRAAFNMFDQNKSGAIEPADLLNIFDNSPLFSIDTAK